MIFAIPKRQPTGPLSMQAAPKEMKPSVRPFGLSSPWKINPGNVEYPNHHPFLTHLGPPDNLKSKK